MTVRPPEFFQRQMQAFMDDKLSSADFMIMSAFVIGEYEKLWNAVKKHSDQKGMEHCWENDLELWKTIDSTVEFPHQDLPDREKFLQGCQEYYSKLVKNKAE